MVYDLIIVGMGPGGISAGIYAYRNGLNVLILEKGMPGGMVNYTSEVANYPGVKETTGPELAMSFFEHIREVGVPYKTKEVLDIKDNRDTKTVVTKDEEYECKKVIIATGRKPRLLGLPNEEELNGKGISRCALCDGHFFKDQDVAVVGGGNSALEETLHLAGVCNKVYLVHRRDELRGDSILQDRIKENDKIEIIYNSQITAINAEDGKLDSITLNDEKELKVKGLFVYIGFEPALDFAKDIIELNPAGYIVVNENYETSCEGIYAVGDIIAKKVYQIVTATSEGATAAINACNKINQGK